MKLNYLVKSSPLSVAWCIGNKLVHCQNLKKKITINKCPHERRAGRDPDCVDYADTAFFCYMPNDLLMP